MLQARSEFLPFRRKHISAWKRHRKRGCLHPQIHWCVSGVVLLSASAPEGQLLQGLATAAHADFALRGEPFFDLSVHGRRVGLREATWQRLCHDRPFIGADSNMAGQDLAASGWLEADQNVAVASSSQRTCRVASCTWSDVDFFVASKSVAEAMEKAQHVIGESPKPHVPITLRKIKQFPLQAPRGCSRKPDELSTSFLAPLRGEEKVDRLHELVINGEEKECAVSSMWLARTSSMSPGDRIYPHTHGATSEARPWQTDRTWEPRPGFGGPHTGFSNTVSMLTWRIQKQVKDLPCAERRRFWDILPWIDGDKCCNRWGTLDLAAPWLVRIEVKAFVGSVDSVARNLE